jgi:steroid 5-alpha reductase family enzyme
VVFISLAQPVLLLLITTPTYILLLMSSLPEPLEFTFPDMIFSRILILCIFVEIFADQQQWRFQKAKKAYQATGAVPEEHKKHFTKEDLDRGFVVVGLWSWCRHPNFLAEQTIWFTLYQWSCYKTDTFFNWTSVGAMGYLILFQGSTWFTESISAEKYPEYKEYQARVGMFIPRWSLEPKKE